MARSRAVGCAKEGGIPSKRLGRRPPLHAFTQSVTLDANSLLANCPEKRLRIETTATAQTPDFSRSRIASTLAMEALAPHSMPLSTTPWRCSKLSSLLIER